MHPMIRAAARRAALAALASAILAGSAPVSFAQGRPDTLRMSCDAARRIISTRGAVVLGTGPDIYDRYVATRGFCQRDETTEPVWLPTADQRQCFVGYRCKRIDDEFER